MKPTGVGDDDDDDDNKDFLERPISYELEALDISTSLHTTTTSTVGHPSTVQ